MGQSTYSKAEVPDKETPEEYGTRMIKGFTDWLNVLTPESDAHQLELIKEIHSECKIRINDAEDGITEADVEQTSKD